MIKIIRLRYSSTNHYSYFDFGNNPVEEREKERKRERRICTLDLYCNPRCLFFRANVVNTSLKTRCARYLSSVIKSNGTSQRIHASAIRSVPANERKKRERQRGTERERERGAHDYSTRRRGIGNEFYSLLFHLIPIRFYSAVTLHSFDIYINYRDARSFRNVIMPRCLRPGTTGCIP